jgi:hypothetical protein
VAGISTQHQPVFSSNLSIPVGRQCIEFKYTETPRTTKSMHAAIADLKLDELIVVYPGQYSFPLGDVIHARPLAETLARISKLL